jgi:hypothetical protein
MANISIELSEDRMRQLREKARQLRVAPEDLLRVSLEDVLARPDDQLSRALQKTLHKNADLYERLS